jgi:hypothetical protein
MAIGRGNGRCGYPAIGGLVFAFAGADVVDVDLIDYH